MNKHRHGEIKPKYTIYSKPAGRQLLKSQQLHFMPIEDDFFIDTGFLNKKTTGTLNRWMFCRLPINTKLPEKVSLCPPSFMLFQARTQKVYGRNSPPSVTSDVKRRRQPPLIEASRVTNQAAHYLISFNYSSKKLMAVPQHPPSL